MTQQEPSHHAGHPIPDPVEADPAAHAPPPAPPPRHVVDPIPPPVEVDSEEVVTATDALPDLTDLGTDVDADSGLEESDPPAGSEDPSGFDLSDLPGLEDEDPQDDAPAESDESTDTGRDDPAADIPKTEGSRLRQVGVGASLFMAALFGMWYLLGDRPDDVPAPPSGQQVEVPGDSDPSSGADSLPGELSDDPTDEDTPQEGETLGEGGDPEGDAKNSETSQQVGAREGEPGGDIKSVRHEIRGPGEHCFIVEMYGDGEAIAIAPTGWYDIIIGVTDPGGDEWRANVAYFGTEPTDRGVRIGPPAPGQETVDGAIVTAEWDAPDTLRSCVNGGETDLAVATFNIAIGVSTDNGTFWDDAGGTAES